MKSFLLSLVLSVVLTTAGHSQISTLLADTLQYTLDHFSAQYQLKGVAAAVGVSHSSAGSCAYGYYGTNDLVTDLLYEIGSNTKTFTATIILQLEAEGQLALDDSLSQYIIPPQYVLPSITLKQLLNHTSGLFDFTQHPDFYPFVNTHPNYIFNIDSMLAEYLSPADFAPGTSWEYCNTNYILLGKVIEAIEGKAYNEVLRERILYPQVLYNTYLDCYDGFGMTHVGAWLDNGQYDGEDFKSFLSAGWSAGGLLATPGNLAGWAFKLYGGRVLEPASFREMTDSIYLNPIYSYGLGLFQRKYKGRLYYGHGGTTLQNSQMEFSKETGFSCVTMVIQQNTANQSLYVQEALIDVLESEISKAISILAVETPAATKESSLTIFPNPATDRATVRLQGFDAANTTVAVYDALGREVRRYNNLRNGMIELQRHEMGAGVFCVVALDTEGNHTDSRKVVFLD